MGKKKEKSAISPLNPLVKTLPAQRCHPGSLPVR